MKVLGELTLKQNARELADISSCGAQPFPEPAFTPCEKNL